MNMRDIIRLVEDASGGIGEVSPEDFSYRDEPDGYLYHVTSEPKAQAILRSGFRPDAGPTMTNYANYSRGKVFFTERDGVMFWMDRVENHLFHNHDDPPEVAVLRVPKAALADLIVPDPVGSRDSRHDCYYIEQPFSG